MGNYSEEKENFLKKILENKIGLCLFFITFSVIINIFGFKLLPRIIARIMNIVFASKSTVRIIVVYLVIYVLISLLWLVFIYIY